jgi:hypothetical protein
MEPGREVIEPVLLAVAPLPIGALLGLVWHDALAMRDLRRSGQAYGRRDS